MRSKTPLKPSATTNLTSSPAVQKIRSQQYQFINQNSKREQTPLRDHDGEKNHSSSFHVMYTGSIDSASFPSMNHVDNLYCRYSLSFGLDWEVVHGLDTGITQTAKQGANCFAPAAQDDGSSTFVWNFPIDVSLKSTSAFGWPRMTLQLYGVDALGRDVIQGYANILCPTAPGHYTKYVPTYTPVSSSPWRRLMQWITGTPPEFYDSKFVAQGDGRDVTKVRCDCPVVKIVLHVATKDMTAFGYTPPS